MGAAASDYLTPHADVQYGFLDEELRISNLHTSAARGDFHRVSMSLKKGLDPNRAAVDDSDDDGSYARGDTPLICAARGVRLCRGTERHLKTLGVLVRFGGDVNKHNFLQQTPLYIACERNLLSIVRWLLTQGADVNKRTKVGISPLLHAYRNENVAMVKLLLDHGAKAVDPPRDFCSIQFPTIAKELRVENTDYQHSSDETPVSPSSTSDVDEADPPAELKPCFCPLWGPKTATAAELEVEGKAPPPRPLPARETVPATPSDTATTSIDSLKRMQMRHDIEARQQQQQQQRDTILSELDDHRRIQEQREYRDKLAVDNAKRKAKRKLRRDKAHYDKHIAHVEQKQQYHGQRSSGTSRSQSTRPETTNAERDSPLLVALRWSNQTPDHQQQQHRTISTAPSRLGRPSWAAQEVSATQAAASTEASRRAGDDALLRECGAVFDALQASRGGLDQLRATYAAAAANLSLPPLGQGRDRGQSQRRSPRADMLGCG